MWEGFGPRRPARWRRFCAAARRDYSVQVEIRLTPDGTDATWLELEHASIADVFHNDPDTGCYGVGTGWEGPLHYLGEYLRGLLPDRPSTEWYTFDEGESCASPTIANRNGRESRPPGSDARSGMMPHHQTLGASLSINATHPLISRDDSFDTATGWRSIDAAEPEVEHDPTRS